MGYSTEITFFAPRFVVSSIPCQMTMHALKWDPELVQHCNAYKLVVSSDITALKWEYPLICTHSYSSSHPHALLVVRPGLYRSSGNRLSTEPAFLEVLAGVLSEREGPTSGSRGGAVPWAS